MARRAEANWSIAALLNAERLSYSGPFYQPDIFAEIATGRGHVWLWARLGLWFERDVLAFFAFKSAIFGCRRAIVRHADASVALEPPARKTKRETL